MTSSSRIERRTLYIQRPGVKNVLSQYGKTSDFMEIAQQMKRIALSEEPRLIICPIS